jgi:hypothetical protein
MDGRLAPEWVAGINRNGWPASSGIAGRNRPEYAETTNEQIICGPRGDQYTGGDTKKTNRGSENIILSLSLVKLNNYCQASNAMPVHFSRDWGSIALLSVAVMADSLKIGFDCHRVAGT